jgi:hypothetical protein
MDVLNAQLIRSTEEGGYRGRADRRALSGRVVSRNDTDRTAIIDIGAFDSRGNRVYFYGVPFQPQNPPQLNDVVSILYGNSSPHSGVISAVHIGGGNSDQVFDNGGVMSIRSDADPKLKGDVTLLSGTGMNITQSGQNITFNSTTGLTPATTVTDVGSSGVVGTSVNYAREDHVHRGVQSIAKSGSAEITGDATLSAGAGITLTQSSNDIQIASSLVNAWINFTINYYDATAVPTLGGENASNREVYIFDTQAQSYTLNLPAIANPGDWVIVRRIISGGGGSVNVVAAGGDDVEGAGGMMIPADTGYWFVAINTTSWWRMMLH